MSDDTLKNELAELKDRLADQSERLDHLESVFERTTGVSLQVDHKQREKSEAKRGIWGLKDKSSSEKTSSKKAAPTQSWEERLGQNLLPKLGVITILIGVSLFLKYSFDQGWITPWGQIIMGLIGGLALLGLGEYFEKKYASWAHVMTGGGLAILYFSLFAGRFFYDLIPLSAAFVSMILVTAMAGYAAVRYDARWIAYLALIGGYWTPQLIQSPSPDPVVLMTYGFILALAVFAISLLKKWPYLTIAAQLLTMVYATWSVTEFELQGGLVTAGVFLLIFSLSGFYRYAMQRHKIDIRGVVEVVLPAAFTALLVRQVVLLPLGDYGLSTMLAILTGYYVILAAVAFWRREAGKENTYAHLLSTIAVVFALAFSLVRLDDYHITLAMLIIFSVVMVTGIALKEKALRHLAHLVGGIALMAWWQNISDTRFVETPWLSNSLVALATMFIGLSILVVWSHYRWPERLNESEAEIKKQMGAYAVVGVAVTWFIITHQIIHGFELKKVAMDNDLTARASLTQLREMIISIFWTIYALALVGVGFWKRLKLFRWLGLILFAATGVKVFLVDTSGLDALYRIVVFIGLGAIAIAASYLYQRYKERLLP
jgi:uncharacterized membrane protein